ncbi:SRPBCC family protein [Sphaerisporangium aureirubrum]|uniref:SRPBCC domain-containing protein n=1 Tax=Sphaerisporangium aureirubrum TaxID=1544736 RepID=A0ABW1NJI1_9ACTN
MTDPAAPPVIEVTITAPVETVWRALREPELIRRWHGWDFAELDEEVESIYVIGIAADDTARVLTIQSGDKVTLHPAGDDTLVRLSRAPIGADPEWDTYYDEITEGWYTFLQQLRFALERHDLAERRTLVLEGALEQPGILVDALGLHGVAELPQGSPYKAETPAGRLTGEVWAVAPGQLLLTAQELGDGLAVLAQQSHTSYRPEGGVLILLTTYGLDDTAFAALETRWTSWWDRHRVTPE